MVVYLPGEEYLLWHDVLRGTWHAVLHLLPGHNNAATLAVLLPCGRLSAGYQEVPLSLNPHIRHQRYQPTAADERLWRHLVLEIVQMSHGRRPWQVESWPLDAAPGL